MGLLERILSLIKDSDVVEVEVSGLFRRVKVKRAGAEPIIMSAPPPMIPRTVAGVPPSTADSTPVTASTSTIDSDLVEIKAPMVGTFYRSPAPDAPPFILEGGTVSKGQVVCIIETMKLMNEIESEYSGTIIKIHVENAKPVQFGDVMFTIRPNS